VLVTALRDSGEAQVVDAAKAIGDAAAAVGRPGHRPSSGSCDALGRL
jgi:hypothetical protein